MRSRLPHGGGVDLEVGLSEAGDALVVARRIERADVKLERLTNPMAQARMVGDIVVSQRVDERAKARCLDRSDDLWPGAFQEMDFELRNGMRANCTIHHAPNEKDLRLFG
jgi:hypothetical protein